MNTRFTKEPGITLRSWLVDRFFRAEVEQRIRLAIPVRDDAGLPRRHHSLIAAELV